MSIIKKSIIAVVLAFTSFSANSQLSKTHYSDWEFVKVVDGDTVKFKVKFLPKELGNTLSIRVNGVDTPEKGHRALCEKKKLLVKKLQNLLRAYFYLKKTK